jgi:hypothetical protein
MRLTEKLNLPLIGNIETSRAESAVVSGDTPHSFPKIA